MDEATQTYEKAILLLKEQGVDTISGSSILMAKYNLEHGLISDDMLEKVSDII